jgi:hypothetical protein
VKVGVLMTIAAVGAIIAGSCGVKSDPRMRPDHPCRTTIDYPGCPSKANGQ